MKRKPSLILVVGGTGTQGGNVARELLKQEYRVKIVTRTPTSPSAKQLEQLGAELVKGDLSEPASLIPVMNDVKAIFSAQYADPNDLSVEIRNTRNMVQAAKDAGVEQIVHTSVVETNIFPRWDKSEMLSKLWESKYLAEELIREAGFPYWTILHPSFFMENFIDPLSGYMAPELKQGKLFGVLYPHTPLKLNNGQDTSLFARTAFENPDKFNTKDINIASDELSMTQIAEIISKISGKTITYEEVDAEEGIQRGLFMGTVESHRWMNDVRGWGFDIKETYSYDIPLTPFEQWLTDNRSRIAK